MTYAGKSNKQLIEEIKKLKAQLKKNSSVKTTSGRIDAEFKPYEHLPLPYVLFTEKQIIYINKKAAETLGFNKTQVKNISNKSIYDFILPEYHSGLKKMNKQILKGKEFNGVEFKIKDSKGNVLDVESKSKAGVYNGKPVQQAIFREITQRKELLDELEQVKNDFNLILHKIDEIVFYYDRNKQKILYISKQIEKILGIKSKDFEKNPGQTLQLCHPDDLKEIYAAAEKIKKTKQPASYKYRIKNRKTKNFVWLEERIFPQFNGKGEHIGNLGVSRDVTSEIEKELKIKESETKFRLLAENASDIVYQYSFVPEPRYVYVSPSAQKILGYSPQEFYNDPYLAYKTTHPDDIHLLRDSEKNVRSGKEIKESFELLVIRHIAKNKKIVWLETRYTEIKEGNKVIALEGISRDITQQKQNEQALFESERTLSNLFSNLPGMAYRCYYDDKWTMKFVSNGCIELTGFLPKELIDNHHNSYSNIVHPDDKRIGRKEIEEALKKRKTFEIEYRILDKNENEKWVWEKGEGVYGKDNALLYIEGFITDISQRKLYEKELNQQWVNYKTVVDHSPNGILIHLNGKVVFANEAALRISGYTSYEELMTISLFDILLPEYKQIAIERVQKVISGEEVPSFEYKAFTAKNELIEIEVKATLIVFNGQQAVQVIVNDLTSQKTLQRETMRAQIAEEANKKLQKEIEHRKKTEQQLQQTQTYLRLIIDSSLDMICASDNTGVITEFNDAAQKTFGYDANEVLGKPVGLLYAESIDNEDVYNRLINSDKAFSGEVTNRKKNGETFVSYLSASVLKNDKGEIIGSMGVSRDITEFKKQEKEILNQSAKLKAIFESSSHLIWTVNRKRELTSFNKNFSETVFEKYDIYPELNKTIDSKLAITFISQYIKYWYPLYDEAFKGKNLKFEKLDTNSKGGVIYKEVFLQPIFNEKNEVVEISCIAHDVTENKKYEKQITEQSAKLKAIFESGDQLIWSVNRNIALTSFNKNYSDSIFDLYGVYPEINKDINSPKQMFTTKEYHDFWDSKYEEVFSGKSTTFVTERINKAGAKKYRQVYLHPIYDEYKNVVEVSGMAYDITELRYYEQETLKHSAKLKAIFDSGSHMIWSIDKNYAITSSNENFNKIFKLFTGDNLKNYSGIDKFVNKIDIEDRKLRAEKYTEAFKGKSQQFEVKLYNDNGKTFWAEVFLEPVMDNDGNIYELSGIAHNITERKIAEEQIRQSLKEKEILLKEVHHRVKNNLQVISSILNLQSTYARDNYTLNLLKECQNRIKSMAFIHESLYQTKDFTEINFSEYVLVLVKNLMHSYSSIDNRVKTRFEVENLLLNLDISIPCGLIVNELVSNALKYAFTDNKEGYIFVLLKREKEKIVLSISDNGVGLPQHIDFRNTESLGLQLVVTLVEQIGGEIAIDTEKGTKFTITFNHHNPDKNLN